MAVDTWEILTGWAKRHLPDERFVAIRGQYLKMRSSLQPVIRLVYGSFDAPALAAHLRQRIGSDFEILMVHSSLNHMQPAFTGTALDLVRMLIDFCGPQRTLAMPAFYFGEPGTSGAYETFQRRPNFDLLRTPSRMGLVTELFRRTKGVAQSRHPVYRVAALGPLAKPLTEGHEAAATYCGPGTPFDFMARHNTRILSIGKPVDVLTQVHHAEDLLGSHFPVPVKSGKPPVEIQLLENGTAIPFRTAGRDFEWTRNMWRLREIMTPEALMEWRFHGVPMFATKAADVTAALVEAASRGVTIYDKPAAGRGSR